MTPTRPRASAPSSPRRSSPAQVFFCYPGFPKARTLLRERLRGTPLALAEVDPSRPIEDQVGEALALIPSMARITDAVIAAAPRLKLIVQFGAGLEGVDRAAAEARGVPVRNVAGVNAQAVGELALFLMLALARRLPEHRRSFESRVVGDPVGSELLGKTVGIVGLGATGRSLARMARGIGMRVIALRRKAEEQQDPDAEWVGGPAELDRLLSEADYVSLHLPTTPQTRGMIGGARLAKMKPTACLVNVGRGDLVDKAALVQALRERRIRGAGLDVYWQEPPDPDDPLLTMDNVVATPHVGGVSEESLARLADRVVAILKEHLLTDGPRA